MSGLLMWLCVLVGTAVLGVLGWAGMKWYGAWALKRDEMERERLQQEWKRRAAERKAKAAGLAPGTEVPPEAEDGSNPPMY
jgi:hypothetical protein